MPSVTAATQSSRAKPDFPDPQAEGAGDRARTLSEPPHDLPQAAPQRLLLPGHPRAGAGDIGDGPGRAPGLAEGLVKKSLLAAHEVAQFAQAPPETLIA